MRAVARRWREHRVDRLRARRAVAGGSSRDSAAARRRRLERRIRGHLAALDRR